MFLVLAALVAGSLFGYFSTGWNRMESACTAEPPGARVARTVEFRWSWAPLGFQCTYDTGRPANLSLVLSSHDDVRICRLSACRNGPPASSGVDRGMRRVLSLVWTGQPKGRWTPSLPLAESCQALGGNIDG